MGAFLAGVLVGAALGAILGLTITVLFGDYLIEKRNRITRSLLMRGKLTQPSAGPANVELFRLGPLPTPTYIVEGDGEQVIHEQSIQVRVEPESVALPPEMVSWRQEFLDEQEKTKRNSQDYFWNGLNYAVAHFGVSRSVIDESPKILLLLRCSDYATFRTTQQLDRRFSDGTTPRTRYLEPFQADPLKVPDFMCSSFGTNIAMITTDRKFIFSRRSHLVGSRPGVWSTSANEGLSRSLDSQGRSVPNLYDVMRRGVREELGISPHEYSLEMLGFTIDLELHQWGGSWIGILNELTGEQVLERRSRGVADKYETRDLRLVDCSPEETLDFMISQGLRGTMNPNAVAFFYLALVRFHGRRSVDRALDKVSRNYEKYPAE
jgi:hypothetical protein